MDSRFSFALASYIVAACLTVAGFFSTPLSAADSYELAEPATDSRVFRVETRVLIEGKQEFAVGKDKSAKQNLKVDAPFQYLERRITGAGRGPLSLRSIRYYTDCEAKITSGDRKTSSRLRDSRRDVVALGNREGVKCYSTSGTFTRTELDLLQAPGDSLAVIGMLPPSKVEVGGDWTPDAWVGQTLTGTEAVLKNELTCTLKSVERGVARVEFTGAVDGAIGGATAKIELSGRYFYDLKAKHVSRLELEQKEQRSVSPVSPGLDVAATVRMERKLSTEQGPLTDRAVEAVPLDPPEDLMLLTFRSPWDARFNHGRDWHLFHQTADVAVLRLLDRGSLLAQCNVTKYKDVAGGTHTEPEAFRNEIREALGDKLKDVDEPEKMKTDDDRYVVRVRAEGETRKIPLDWIYYLNSAKDGRQVVFVFSIEKKLAEKLGNRDQAIVRSLVFDDRSVKPAGAEEDAAGDEPSAAEKRRRQTTHP